MDAVFLKLLNLSLTASWLCLAVLLVRLLLKKAPKAISCALWALVGLRLLFPFSIESMLSLIPSAEPLPEDMLLSPTPTINSGIPVINEVVNPVISDSLAPTPGDSVNPMQVITTVAGYVWVIGMVAMLVYMLASYLRVRGKVAEAVKIEGNVYECDHVDTPFILGVIRPRIYLPSSMSDSDRAFVIAHEQAHLRRLDHVWKPLGFLLLTVYWFNPLLWLGYILLCRDIELACDEKVIRQLGTDIKKQYSEALINCSVPRRAISACPLAFGEVGVKGRIKSVLNYKKPAFWIILVAVVALIVTGVCFLTDPLPSGSASFEEGYYYFNDLVYGNFEHQEALIYNANFGGPFYFTDEGMYCNESDPFIPCHKVELTKENFDSVFDGSTWKSGMSARRVRKNTIAAWEFEIDYFGFDRGGSVVEFFKYLLLQEDGTLYCALVWEDMRTSEFTITGLYQLQSEDNNPADIDHTNDEDLGTSILHDIDGDGTMDYCEIGLGHLSGFFTFTLTVMDENKSTTKYYASFYHDYCSPSFVRNESGLVYLRTEALPQGSQTDTHYYDIGIESNCIVLSENGKRLNVRDLMKGYTYSIWDFTTTPEIMYYSSDKANELSGTRFVYEGLPSYSQFKKIKMINNAGKETELISGTVVMKAGFADLNGDGYNEFLGQANIGSGYIHEFIVVYDIKNDRFYRLEERFSYDFYLVSPNNALSVTIFDVRSNSSRIYQATPFLVKRGDDYVLELRRGSDVLYRSYADGTQESLLPDRVVSYVFHPDNDLFNRSSVTLFEDQTFQFVFSPVSSYLGDGKYEIKDDQLILSTDDGKYTYIFEIQEDKLVYRENVNGYHWMGHFTDGSEFIKQN